MPGIFWLVPVIALVTVIFIIYLARYVLAKDTGTPKMKEVGDMIFEGAWAFLNRQYRTIGILAIFVAIFVGIVVGLLSGDNTPGNVGQAGIMWRTGLAFLVGALCSGVSGFAGMYIAVKSNVRCAAAAQRSWREAIDVAMRGGAVSGFLITTLSLVGVTAIFFAFGGNSHPDIAPHLIVGFGFGASFVALFAQLGGGIYTKAADMGADLVGKVEAGIPEDDARNAAVIADLVGDNVGDCAGRGADLFESTAAENIGAMILGATVYAITKDVAWIIFPLVVRAFGLVASMIGLLIVKAKEQEDPMAALNRGYWVSIILSAVGMVVTVSVMLGNVWLAFAGLTGITASVAILYITQYYTDTKYKPVKDLAQASRTGSATNIVGGIGIGFETAFPTTAVIAVALLVSYALGKASGVEGAGAFGTAVATMGMLMTCPYVLAMDTFGPITDNANGINEMAGAGPQVRKITDKLDAVGNTTKALTKGYALVSAGLAAFLLFQAYMDQVAFLRGTTFDAINLARPEVFVGAMVAVMLVFLFSAWAIQAVGSAAQKIIEEVRRQFRENPKIMTWEAKPDYARAVDITARAGLRGMIKPGVLPVLAPLVLGVGFKLISSYDAAQAVGAMLMVGTIGGIMMAAFMNNAGGAWDNAKKYIEDGQLKDDKGVVQGKRTFAHAAAVVGDTVGDPLKDTAGPSLHVLIKLLSTITLVLVPLII